MKLKTQYNKICGILFNEKNMTLTACFRKAFYQHSSLIFRSRKRTNNQSIKG